MIIDPRAGLPRLAARTLPHVAKHAVCCGLFPFLATAAGMQFLRLQEWQEYAFAGGAALVICAADDVWHRRFHKNCEAHKPGLGRILRKYAGWVALSIALTFAIHTAGLHPHRPQVEQQGEAGHNHHHHH